MRETSGQTSGSRLLTVEAKGTRVLSRNLKSRKALVLNCGGAGSSKSYSIAQLFVMRFMGEKGKKFLVTRKTLPALKLTAYRLIVELLKEYGVYGRCHHNKTDNTIDLNGNLMAFLSVDDPEKIKSTEWNYAWMEEANEFTWGDYITLKTRMRGPIKPGEINQIFLSYNPSDEQGWIHQRLEPGVDECDLIHSTFHDNPFLSQEYVSSLLGLREEDASFHKIFTLGEYATPVNIIYSNWNMVQSMPVGVDDLVYGLDFGFNNPSSLVCIGFRDGDVYLDELIYERKLTNAQLMERMDAEIVAGHAPIYADCAEPQRIEEIRQYQRKNGGQFNVHPSDKAVKNGIDSVKRCKLHITERSVNLLKEIRSYKWREDKNGNVLDEPVKFLDHAVDAVRYGIHSHSRPLPIVEIY